MKKVIIIQASNRSDGNTFKAVTALQSLVLSDIVDIKMLDIGHFNYDFVAEDDFLPLIIDIIEKYETVLFATPVYWYSMSGLLKVFFDRITDLITTHRSIGKQFRTKNMAVLAVGSADFADFDFFLPFRKTAVYLKMPYVAETIINANEKGLLPSAELRLKLLVEQLLKAESIAV